MIKRLGSVDGSERKQMQICRRPQESAITFTYEIPLATEMIITKYDGNTVTTTSNLLV